jgi:hypothetical protein
MFFGIFVIFEVLDRRRKQSGLQVYFVQEGLEAGVGVNRIVCGTDAQVEKVGIAFINHLFQPVDIANSTNGRSSGRPFCYIGLHHGPGNHHRQRLRSRRRHGDCSRNSLLEICMPADAFHATFSSSY